MASDTEYLHTYAATTPPPLQFHHLVFIQIGRERNVHRQCAAARGDLIEIQGLTFYPRVVMHCFVVPGVICFLTFFFDANQRLLKFISNVAKRRRKYSWKISHTDKTKLKKYLSNLNFVQRIILILWSRRNFLPVILEEFQEL